MLAPMRAYGADGKDFKMAKDTRKATAARSRWQKGVKKGKAGAKEAAVRRGIREDRSDQETKRQRQRQRRTGR